MGHLQLADVGPNHASTFVAKVSSKEAVWPFAVAQMANGEAGAVASVEMPKECYLVLSGKERAIPQYAHKLKQQILHLPGETQVAWVRPLTRRLQRLFGWGDVTAMRADVAAACKNNDAEEAC